MADFADENYSARLQRLLTEARADLSVARMGLTRIGEALDVAFPDTRDCPWGAFGIDLAVAAASVVRDRGTALARLDGLPDGMTGQQACEVVAKTTQDANVGQLDAAEVRAMRAERDLRLLRSGPESRSMTGSEFTAAALLGILQDEATRIAARLGLPLVVELGLRAEADRDAVTVTFYVPRPANGKD